MIENEKIYDLVNSLKSHTTTALKESQKLNTPYIIGSESPYKTSNSIIPVKRYHYDNRWRYFQQSDIYPEETFGILKVENIPYLSFRMRDNKQSFVSSMDRLVNENYVIPFMLFVDNKFVSWNDIDVVYDCGESYLLLHGLQYTYDKLKRVNSFYIIILPYNVNYISIESDNIFNSNLNALTSYLQDSLYTDEDNKIRISVPMMDSEYNMRGAIYNVGSWLYRQIRLDSLGMLSDDRKNKLKNITLSKHDTDYAGNHYNIISTRFNALDKDVYDIGLYERITDKKIEYYSDKQYIAFDNDGLFNIDGENKLYILNDSIMIKSFNTTNENIFFTIDDLPNNASIDKDNFIVFSNGCLDIDSRNNISVGPRNMCYNHNGSADDRSFVFFYNIGSPIVFNSTNKFSNNEYINNAVNNYLAATYADSVQNQETDFISSFKNALDYSFSTKKSYEENMTDAIDAIIKYDPLLFNSLIRRNVDSVTLSASEVNGIIDQYGELRVYRTNVDNNETFCIIFLNGELIENYCNMSVYPNYLSLPMDPLSGNDKLEILYFNNCNNNEILYQLRSTAPNREEETGSISANKYEDYSYIKARLDEGYDFKVFCKNPPLLVYRELIKPSNDLAFNITNNLEEYSGYYPLESTIVSTRRFAYQNIKVRYKSYRVKLDGRFRYCDNKDQYMLFINGRRMNNDSFFITTPKIDRPFWGNYLYTTRFIGPEDRVELFYVPYPMDDHNKNGSIMSHGASQIVTTEHRNLLEVPYDNKLYAVFINGKKVDNEDLVILSTDKMLLKRNNYMINNETPIVVNYLYNDTVESVVDYLRSNDVSEYDEIINSIYDKDNNLFNTLLDIPIGGSLDENENAITQNVARIAVLNEIIRDFWVSSGYDYNAISNNIGFLYDYESEEGYIEPDENGNVLLPSLDASLTEEEYINIKKNKYYLISFTANGEKTALFEKGSTDNTVTLEWLYNTDILTGSAPILLEQDINGIKIPQNNDNNDNYYSYTIENVSEDEKYILNANNGYEAFFDSCRVKFVEPVYYGAISQEIMSSLARNSLLSIEDIIALVPKNGILPTAAEMIRHMKLSNPFDYLEDEYKIYYNLLYDGIDELDATKYTILPFEFMQSLIALISNETRTLSPEEFAELSIELMEDDKLEALSDRGMDYIKEKYLWYTLDEADGYELLLVHPYAEPIDFISWLQAIVSVDDRDPVWLPDWLPEDSGLERIIMHKDVIIPLNSDYSEMQKESYAALPSFELYDPNDPITVNSLIYYIADESELKNGKVFENPDMDNFIEVPLDENNRVTPKELRSIGDLLYYSDDDIMYDGEGNVISEATAEVIMFAPRYDIFDQDLIMFYDFEQSGISAGIEENGGLASEGRIDNIEYYGYHGLPPKPVKEAKVIDMNDYILTDVYIDNAVMLEDFYAIFNNIQNSNENNTELMISGFMQLRDETFDEVVSRTNYSSLESKDSYDEDGNFFPVLLSEDVVLDSDDIKSMGTVYTEVLNKDLLFDIDTIDKHISWLNALSYIDGAETSADDFDMEVSEDPEPIQNEPIADITNGFMAYVLNDDGTFTGRVIDVFGNSNNIENSDYVDDLNYYPPDDEPTYNVIYPWENRYIAQEGLQDIMNEISGLSEEHNYGKLFEDLPNTDYSCKLPNGSYFIFAMPKKYAYNGNYTRFKFINEDINGAISNYISNDPSVIYSQNPLLYISEDSSNKIKMEFIGETEFKTKYGLKITYVLWKTNGYFNRLDPTYDVRFRTVKK